MERRFAGLGLSLRAEMKSGRKLLTGTAAPFNSLSLNLGGFKERLVRGCFAAALRANDILMLNGHDVNQIVARTSNGTLELAEDPTGLQFEAELGNSTFALDLYTNVREGLIDSMSFGFNCVSERWTKEKDANGTTIDVRCVLDADLREISATPVPAYESSDLAARALFPTGLPASMPMEVRSRFPELDPDAAWRWKARQRLRLSMMDL